MVSGDAPDLRWGQHPGGDDFPLPAGGCPVDFQHPRALRERMPDRYGVLARGEVHASPLVLQPLVPSAPLSLS
jgi:hypothetical protein